jgi:hypothetical protein
MIVGKGNRVDAVSFPLTVAFCDPAHTRVVIARGIYLMEKGWRESEEAAYRVRITRPAARGYRSGATRI